MLYMSYCRRHVMHSFFNPSLRAEKIYLDGTAKAMIINSKFVNLFNIMHREIPRLLLVIDD